jgi:methionyl-tRNA formyltransferase
MDIGANLVIKTVDLISSGKYSTQKQPEIASTNAPKLYKETCQINWDTSLITIHNMIRGLSPYPAAWSRFTSKGEINTMKIYKTHVELIEHDGIIGSIISTKKSIKVVVKDGYLYLDEIQLSGKRKLDIKSLLNGFQFSSNAMMSW